MIIHVLQIEFCRNWLLFSLHWLRLNNLQLKHWSCKNTIPAPTNRKSKWKEKRWGPKIKYSHCKRIMLEVDGLLQFTGGFNRGELVLISPSRGPRETPQTSMYRPWGLNPWDSYRLSLKYWCKRCRMGLNYTLVML